MPHYWTPPAVRARNENVRKTMNPGPRNAGYPSGIRVNGSFKKGGKVKSTGIYKLHKGEVVVPKKKVKKLAKSGIGLLRRAMKIK